MLTLKLSKDLKKKNKANNKEKTRKGKRSWMHDSDVFWASLFTRDGNKADKGGSRVPKAREAGEQGTESGRC